ncbi:UNVERIFIED_ORG: hypothetical protein M2438_005397 [Methylobacterium sp. SuP10 SLI 274]|uniref:hypothetical protein n=1 Tax=Methylorubrum extorquens TaxID=408 RepID=UPI00209DFBB8|nr:hypothetical protein [Methylorubrum extorquens]MDF9866403.1 hypothetical protein [Methylorubrum pseudosasae]MDH6640151.1 hypothetical protein [Methylobacterium sp. SuP10 SLI 274]MDH6669340.1 hypothetical protein [Methylorubrum zatmanii]MCP1561898.1 hypothetical protein [Methylorubrum extorquens]MDF9794696.1 hypothetical protein [Methylorubrum extorquens]
MDTLRVIDPNTGQSVSMSYFEMRNWQINYPTSNVDAQGRPTSKPLKIDTQWYMNAGPGIYYNPARFEGVSKLLNSSPSQLGLSNGQSKSLASFFSSKDPLIARVSHYTTDVNSETYGIRSWVWGGTSAVIEGEITNINGRIALTNYKIAPIDDNFNFFPDISNPIKHIINAGARTVLSGTERGVPLDFNKSQLTTNTSPYYIENLSQDARINTSKSGIFSASTILNTLDNIGEGLKNRCFLADTMITMGDGTEKEIQNIVAGDMVSAFSGDSHFHQSAHLESRKVTRTFRNISKCIIDLRGVKSTPGHHFLTLQSEGDHGEFKPLSRILRNDGIIVEHDRSAIRARTGAKIGSNLDIKIKIVFYEKSALDITSTEKYAVVRSGIPLPPTTLNNGVMSWCVRTLAEHLESHDVTILSDGSLRTPDGAHHTACNWPADSTPLDSHEARNWIVELDGALYTPPWIRDLVDEDEHEGLRVGALPISVSSIAS